MNKFINTLFFIALFLSALTNVSSNLVGTQKTQMKYDGRVQAPVYTNPNIPRFPGDNLADAVKNLGAAETKKPDTDQEAINKSTCSNNSGFGFNGRCLSQAFTSSSNAGVPSDVNSAFNFLYQILFKIGSPFDMCFGDYTGEEMQSMSNLSHTKCDTMPLMENFKYGAFGSYVANVYGCGTNPVTIAFCAVFDRCGTVAISGNAGLAQCAATMSTGIAAILAPVSTTIDYLSFGISPKRRFIQEFEIAYRNGDQVATKKIKTYGHFLIGLGLGFPLKDLTFGGKSLEDLFSLNLSATFTVDFGNSASTVQNLILNILSANQSTGRELVKNILNTNAEMTLQIKGTFSLNFNDLTRGFLPNLEFNLGEGTILISSGGSDAASGMRAGAYIFINANFNSIIKTFVDKINDQFGGILRMIGINSIPFPSSNVSLGIFVDQTSLGFEVFGLGMELRCIFIYNGNKGSCKFDAKWFTALLQGAKWVIKAAKKFFEETGKDIVEFGSDVGKFGERATQAAANFFSNDARNFFERDVGGTAQYLADNVYQNLNQGWTATKDALNAGLDGINSGFNTVGEGVKKGWKKAKKALKKW